MVLKSEVPDRAWRGGPHHSGTEPCSTQLPVNTRWCRRTPRTMFSRPLHHTLIRAGATEHYVLCTLRPMAPICMCRSLNGLRHLCTCVIGPLLGSLHPFGYFSIHLPHINAEFCKAIEWVASFNVQKYFLSFAAAATTELCDWPNVLHVN